MDKSNMQLHDLIQFFDTYNRSDGKSPCTLRWYRQSLGMLLGWLTETGRPTTLGYLDENSVREFILWMQGRRIRGQPIRVPTVNNRVRALRSFFNWLFRKGYTESHLLQDVKPPRLPRVMVDILSDDEISRIMSSLEQSTMTGSRNVAILAMFLDSGLRLSELAGLKAMDVHIEDQYVKVLGKGSKERMVAFGNTARNALLHYSVHFRGEPAHSGVEEFFLTIDGYPMSNQAVKSMLRRVGAAAGVPRLHAHLCRHTYATNFLINGGNVLLLKQNLGHTTLAMVDHYVHLATSKVAVLSRDFSPLDRLNIRGLHRGGNGDRGNRRNGVKVFQRCSG
ncbi:MAG: tyrosine-type recombinase/integrase [Chloroflexota bacterium]|nr:tyrosine-type recombinase/integrase [Chloroflexota bacterium]